MGVNESWSMTTHINVITSLSYNLSPIKKWIQDIVTNRLRDWHQMCRMFSINGLSDCETGKVGSTDSLERLLLDNNIEIIINK